MGCPIFRLTMVQGMYHNAPNCWEAHLLLHTYRPVGKLKKLPRMASNVRDGDMVSWTNPNTGQCFEGIEVLRVVKTTGAALLRGYRGGVVRGRPHIESFSALLDQLTVTKRGGV